MTKAWLGDGNTEKINDRLMTLPKRLGLVEQLFTGIWIGLKRMKV
jgi:hypothetical protein